jgi:hypothetical protein
MGVGDAQRPVGGFKVNLNADERRDTNKVIDHAVADGNPGEEAVNGLGPVNQPVIGTEEEAAQRERSVRRQDGPCGGQFGDDARPQSDGLIAILGPCQRLLEIGRGDVGGQRQQDAAGRVKA